MTTKNPYGLTRANRANLLKLADYLESLPRSYKHFDMEVYTGKDDYEDDLIDYMRNNGGLYDKCNTVGCALGHGPSAGVLARLGTEIEARYYSSSKGDNYYQVNWIKYGYRFVAEDLDNYQLVWDFLFSGAWGGTHFDCQDYATKVDDHHYGAAARIRYILAGRLIPDTFDDLDRLELVRAKRLYKEFRK